MRAFWLSFPYVFPCFLTILPKNYPIVAVHFYFSPDSHTVSAVSLEIKFRCIFYFLALHLKPMRSSNRRGVWYLAISPFSLLLELLTSLDTRPLEATEYRLISCACAFIGSAPGLIDLPQILVQVCRLYGSTSSRTKLAGAVQFV